MESAQPTAATDRDALAAALAATFEDFCMSRGERHALRELLEDVRNAPETLSFARNRAFDLVQASLRESPEHRLDALRWLEEVVKGIAAVKDTQLCGAASAHFSPGNYCANQIIWLIRAARASIDACVFTIADDRISDELVRAHQRGIKVRVVTDNDKSHDLGSDVRRFAREGISVKTDNSPSHMHHKFAIFDGKVLVNGSFNWTRSASQNNQENIVVMADPAIIASFSREFARLWDACIDL
jgi:phosphatidylserine/phosphatidylglycerophosphate/cardiolipin synthase-like enzyme